MEYGHLFDMKIKEEDKDEVEMFEQVEVLVEQDGYTSPSDFEEDGYTTPVPLKVEHPSPIKVEDTTHVGDMPLKMEDCKPFMGKDFQTEEAAYEFYNRCFKVECFSIKRNQSRRSVKTGELVWRTFSCSKEGFLPSKKDECHQELKQKRVRYTTRTGCGAKMVISKNETENVWGVTNFNDDHTHALMSSKKVHFLRSHRRMGPTSKKFVEECNKVGIRPSRAYKYMVEKSGGHSGVGFVKRDVQNVIRDVKMKWVGADAAAMSQYLAEKIKVDPHSFFLFEMNDDTQLSAAFWTDGRSRSDYSAFGDVVCFDTTYKTNKYRMPFAPFVGLNHHGQSIFFGCGLLSDETTDSFVWLFDSFLVAMGNVAPKIIITDQDAAIAAAVAKVFPQTRHRYCMWHITQKFPEKLGYHYTINKDLSNELKACLYQQNTISAFEESWQSILSKHNLEGNEWLQGLYEIREKWVPVYFNDVFTTGMATNQRSESMHAFMDFYMKSHTPLREFVEQFDSALQDRRDEEAKADYQTKNMKIQCRTAAVEMETTLCSIYTMHNFKELQEELFQGVILTTKVEDVNGGLFIHMVQHPDRKNKAHWVAYHPDEARGTCTCRKWDTTGIMCRHIFCVLWNTGVLQLPTFFILKRLTRNPREGLPHWEPTAISKLGCASTSPAVMALDDLLGRARAEAVENRDSCMALIETLTKQLHAMQKQKDPLSQKPSSSFDPQGPHVADPPIVRTKGYSSGARLKSGKEIAMGKSKGKCGVCHKQGHNRRSCPLLKCSLGRVDLNIG